MSSIGQLQCANIDNILGVTTFVCLMEQEEREKKRFVRYEDVAVEIAAEYDRTLTFLYFPFAGEQYCSILHHYEPLAT